MSGKSKRGSLIGVFARNVRAARIRLGLSESELAERVQVHRDYVGMIERGQTRVTLRKVERMADALGVDAATLLIRDVEESRPEPTTTPETP